MHSIRLREPWLAAWKNGESGLWAQYSRRFHRPTGLQPFQSVALMVRSLSTAAASASGTLRGRLNCVDLSFREDKDTLQVTVEEALESFNDLELLVELPGEFAEFGLETAENPNPPPPLTRLFDVRLAIRD